MLVVGSEVLGLLEADTATTLVSQRVDLAIRSAALSMRGRSRSDSMPRATERWCRSRSSSNSGRCRIPM